MFASRPTFRAALSATFLAASIACAQQATPGWTDLLADGTAAWRDYGQPDLSAGWTYDPATRVLTRSGRGGAGGGIITKAQYTDFELELEWRVGPRGNSGVFYRVTEGPPVIYHNAPEYQILDNAGHPDGRNSSTSAGANYALNAPVSDVTRPVGEWNHTRIVVRGAHVEHWLNGTKVVEYQLWTPEWTAAVKASKFNQWPGYGLGRRGHIGLQDHGDVVDFRNIRVRELR
jgi:hypothetical protein